MASSDAVYKTYLTVSSVAALTTYVSLISILSRYGGNPDARNDNDNNNDNNSGDGGGSNDGEHWWDGPDAEERGQLIYASVVLMLVLTLLIAVGVHTFVRSEGATIAVPRTTRTITVPTPKANSHISSLRMGMLAGATAMYANLAIIVCFCFANLERDDDDDRDGRRYLEENGDDQDDAREEEDEEGQGQKMLSTLGLVAFIVYALLAGLTVVSSRLLTQDHRNGAVVDLGAAKQQSTCGDGAKQEHAQSSGGQVNLLSDAFKHLSIISIVSLSMTFLVGIISLFAEEGDRMKEEGLIYNYLLATAWVLLLVISLTAIGYRRVFRHNVSIAQLEIGFFLGSLYFFGGVALLIAGLYSGISLEGLGDGRRRGGEEGPVGSLFLSFLCLALTVAYVSYATLFARYHPCCSVLRTADDGGGHGARDESDYNEMSEEGETSGVEFAGRSSRAVSNKDENEDDGSGELAKNDNAVLA